MITHTDDCNNPPFYDGDEECVAVNGEWMQPPGIYVGQAEADLGDGAPWCAIRKLAWELRHAEELLLDAEA
jgi:hypothetical protein